MKIEYLHASKYGNGARVAAEVQHQLDGRGIAVEVHHIREVRPTDLPSADLYVFSAPGRMGKPRGSMRRFLKKLKLPAGTRYAVLTTEAAPKPDKAGRMPTDEELAKWQRVIPIMEEMLDRKGLIEIAAGTVHVTGLKGPLEDAWQKKVEAFAGRLAATVPARDGARESELRDRRPLTPR